MVGSAPANGAALDLDRDFLSRRRIFVDDGLDAGFLQVQVDLRRSQGVVLGERVEPMQQAAGQLHGALFAADAKHIATVGDLHAEAKFDLAQVLVQRANQIGQALAVVGLEGEIGAMGFAHRRARVTCNAHRSPMTSVTGRKTSGRNPTELIRREQARSHRIKQWWERACSRQYLFRPSLETAGLREPLQGRTHSAVSIRSHDHGCTTWMVLTGLAPTPRTSGRYMSSTCGGGTRNVPGDTARTR